MSNDKFGTQINRETLLVELILRLIDVLAPPSRQRVARAQAAEKPAHEAEEESVSRFVQERCATGQKLYCTVAELKEEYEEWAAEQGELWAVTRQTLGRRLRAMGYVQDRFRVPGTGLARVWRGIAPREPEKAVPAAGPSRAKKEVGR